MSSLLIKTLIVLAATFLCLRAEGGVESTLSLVVIPATTTTPGGYVQLDVPMSNTTKHEGETIRIKCEITGFPLPRYQWFKDGELLEGVQGSAAANAQPAPRISAKTTPWGSRLKVDEASLQDSGVYTCEGFNKFGRQSTNGSVVVKPGPNPNRERFEDGDGDPVESWMNGNPDGRGRPSNNGKQTGDYADYGDDNDAYDGGAEDAASNCQPYRGVACSSYIGGKNVYINGQYQQGHIDDTISEALSVIAGLDSGVGQSNYQLYQCSGFISSALCQFAFPVCDNRFAVRRLCRSDCLALETDICRPLYDLTRSHSAVSSQLVLPECHQLPDDEENCIHIGLPAADHSVDNKHQCYNFTGVEYRGTESVSSSGNVCLRWTLAATMFHHLGDHNYCRNPDSKLNAPWCFTASNKQELCNVQKCVSVLAGGSRMDSNAVVQILIPCLAVPAAVCLLLLIIRLRRRCKQTTASTKSDKVNRRHHTVAIGNSNPMELNPMLVMSPAGNGAKNSPMKCPEYPSSSVKYLSKLCTGFYGPVYRAELLPSTNVAPLTSAAHCSVPIAVKTLSSSASQEMRTEFWAKAERQSTLSHPNIVCMVGLCRGSFDSPPGLFYEFAFYGDLHEYLAVHSPHSDIAVVDISGRQQILQHSDMLRIAVQLSAGMEYLSSHYVIHQDLAARSVLVGNMGLAKLCDLELGRDAYPLDYYAPPGSSSSLPVRWMAPESILSGTYSVESDVWSFGVTLWEIYSFGLQPYYGRTNQDVVDMASGHQVLPSPVNCPTQLYALMIDCWNAAPSKRPSFAVIHRRLRQWVDELTTLTTATSIASDQSFNHSMASSSPRLVRGSNGSGGGGSGGGGVAAAHGGGFQPHGQTTSPVLSGIGGFQAVEPAHRPLLMASNGLPFPMNYYNVGPDAAARQGPMPGMLAAGYYRHQPEAAGMEATNCPKTSPGSYNATAKMSNTSSISSASDCKSPRWPSVNHCPADESPKPKQTIDVTPLHQQSHHALRI